MGKRWIFTIGLFVLSQCIFILIDGTILEPQLNSIGYYMMKMIGPKLRWFTLYHHPFLKCITLLFLFYIIIKAMKDIVVFLKMQKS